MTMMAIRLRAYLVDLGKRIESLEKAVSNNTDLAARLARTEERQPPTPAYIAGAARSTGREAWAGLRAKPQRRRGDKWRV
jgi:hypothetical protein